MRKRASRAFPVLLTFVLAAGFWFASDGKAAPNEVLFDGPRWEVRFDMGGTIPQDAELTEFNGPVTGESMKLSPGFQMDLALNYKITRWLSVGPELGLLYNGVDSFGHFSYHDTYLFQMPMMANLTLEYPTKGFVVPFIGGGVGGVASALTFGENGYYEPDGSGTDFSLAFQAVAGLNFRLGKNAHLGVIYRFLYTDSPDWNVEWWDNSHFNVAVNSLEVHSFCIAFTVGF